MAMTLESIAVYCPLEGRSEGARIFRIRFGERTAHGYVKIRSGGLRENKRNDGEKTDRDAFFYGGGPATMGSEGKGPGTDTSKIWSHPSAQYDRCIVPLNQNSRWYWM